MAAYFGYFCCECGESDGDRLRRLRHYASNRWMSGSYDAAIAEEDFGGPAAYLPETDADFADLFVKVMTRAGYPIIKYGRGKTVRRTLRVSDDLATMTWNSSKGGDGDAPGSDGGPAKIFLHDVDAVDRAVFDDTPPGAEALCVAFHIPSFMGARAVVTVFKVLVYFEADVHVLLNGFRILRDRLSRDARYSRRPGWPF